MKVLLINGSPTERDAPTPHWAGATGAMTSFMDRVFYADLNGGGSRFRLKPAAAGISARRAGTTATWD